MAGTVTAPGPPTAPTRPDGPWSGGRNRLRIAGASWRRCRIHYLRNLLSRVPKSAQPHVATEMRTDLDHADTDAVTAQFDRVVDALAAKYPDAAAHLEAARDDLLAFTGYPHQICARSDRIVPRNG